jgi:ABC-type transport system involved in multi-copper enzyme maturation permease subunit
MAMRLNVRLTDLSPFGPIFGKELRITARRKRNHLLRVAYLGGLLLFLLLVWSEGYYNRAGGGVAERIQQQNRLGQEFFLTFSMFCSISMALIAPVLTSTAISSERLGKTLAVLLMTPITSWQIVSGKLLSRLLIALMLIGLSLPVLALVRLLGGVEPEQMLCVLIICTVFAMSCGAIGLFFSTLMNRAYAVILLSYASILLLYVFVPMLVITVATGGRGPGLGWLRFLLATNPVFAVGWNAAPDRALGFTVNWWPCATIQLGLTIALLLCSATLLRWFARREGQRAAPAPITPELPMSVQVLDEPAASAPAVADPAPVLQYARKRVHPTREVGDNPVLWRELRKPLFTMRWAWIGGALVVAVLLLTYWACESADALDEEETQCVYAVIMHGLYWMLIAVLSATSIAQEKESDTWTVLLVAPLSAGSIVIGKLLGLSRRMLWPTLFVLGHFTLFAVTGVIAFPIVLVVLWVMITFNSVWAALGIYLSLRLKKVTSAVIVNLVVPVVVFVAAPVILLILGELFARTDDLAEVVLWYLPYYYLGYTIDHLGGSFDLGRTMYLPNSSGESVPAAVFVMVIILVGLIHLAVAGFILWRTIRGFDHYVGRATQWRPNSSARLAAPLAGSP